MTHVGINQNELPRPALVCVYVDEVLIAKTCCIERGGIQTHFHNTHLFSLVLMSHVLFTSKGTFSSHKQKNTVYIVRHDHKADLPTNKEEEERGLSEL